MAARKRIKRMLEALPEALVGDIPQELKSKPDFLEELLIFRRENMGKYRTIRKELNREFCKKHNIKKRFKPLYKTTKSKGKSISKEMKRALRADKNLIVELQKIINNRFPKLMSLFANLTDKRQKGKIKYSMKSICLTRLLALVCGIISMRDINEEFNTNEIKENIKLLTGEDINDIPDWQTIQDALSRVAIDELLDIRKYMVKAIIESKIFDRFREDKNIQVLIDATGLTSRDYNLNGNCISKKYKDGKVKYFKYALEAKIVFGNIVISLDTEWIENTNINNENDKQDCEINAFKRMAIRIKKSYPRLPILITGDALYAASTVIQICKDNNWKYIFNLKPNRLKNVNSQLETSENYIKLENYRAVRKIKYKGHTFTAFSYTEISKDGKKKIFRYITNLIVNNDNIVNRVLAGRRRWKIENECFNVQKNGEYCISHLCSFFDNLIKIHYLFMQIAHLLRQFLELGSIVVKDMFFTTKREISTFLRESLTQKIISNQTDFYQKIQLRFDM